MAQLQNHNNTSAKLKLLNQNVLKPMSDITGF